MKKTIKIPQSFWGKELKNKTKKARITIYLKQAIIFGLWMTVLDSLVLLWKELLYTIHFTDNTTIDIILTMVLVFILAVIVSFVMDYIRGETMIKRYNKKIGIE